MKIKIISQTKTILTGECVKLTVPTVLGEITVLPHHANLITILDIGIVYLWLNNTDKQEILINGGIMEVRNDNINILANEADLREDLVEEEIQQAINSAQRKISSTITKSELIRLEKELRYHKFKQRMLKS